MRAALAEKDAQLGLAKGDLSRDEQIFSEKVKQVAALQAELQAVVDRTQQREEAMAARMQHMQAELQR